MRAVLVSLLLLCATPAFATPAAAGPESIDMSDATRPSNAEMTAIYDADQAVRMSKTPIDWKLVRPADRARRTRTQELLGTGSLHSADDFYHAAYVYQHGDLPEDYLTAHALAVIAAARGKPEAAWIAAATLDRYLQSIGQPQIYGTQFRRSTGSDWSQEPYRRDLLSDALRRANGVPPIAEQEEKRKGLPTQP
ncbi:hypothetical protein [Sphingomonas sp. UYP23]